MKKFAFLLAAVLALSGCAGQDKGPAGAGNTSDTQAEALTMPEKGVWPANDYTQGLPEPAGTVVWAVQDDAHENCSISITDMGEAEYNSYLDRLKEDGFSVAEEISEEIKGQDDLSVGTLLSDGERWLSICYLPNSFTIYISFEA